MLELPSDYFAKQSSKPGLTISELFEIQVANTPNAIAVSYQSQSLTYNELNKKSNQLARVLRKNGVKTDDIIAVCMDRNIDLILTLLAITKSGAAFLPIDPFNPNSRIDSALKDSNAFFLITQESLTSRLNDLGNVFNYNLISSQASNEVDRNLERHSHLDSFSYVIYTSGSTGKPKGVINVQKGIVNQLTWMKNTFKINSLDRVLQTTSISFDPSIWEILLPLISGAQLLLSSTALINEEITDIIYENEVTIASFVPTSLKLFVDSKNSLFCKSLRLAFCGGEPLEHRTCQKFFKISNATLINFYGMSEASIVSSFYKCHSKMTNLVPIGKPIANTKFYILDKNKGILPDGTEGDLYISGDGLALRYTDIKQTKKKFVWLELNNNLKVQAYFTQDRAKKMPDGNYQFLGRIDDQIKIRGFSIFPREIESALMENHIIKQAVILKTSKHADILTAFLIKNKADEKLTFDQLRTFLLTKLPGYMCPNSFIWLDNFPLSLTGKIDKKKLAKIKTDLTNEQHVLPRNEIEALLCNSWKRVFGLDTIGVGDNFFDLGGDSIAAIQIATHLRARGLFVESASIFLFPTISELSKQCKPFLSQNTGSNKIPDYSEIITTLETNGIICQNDIEAIYPTTKMQANIIYQCNHSKRTSIYINQIRMELHGDLSLKIFRQAWEIILQRHAILRTFFLVDIHHDFLQIVMKKCDLPIDTFNLSELSADEEKVFIDDQINRIHKDGFVLNKAPLWRLQLFYIEKGKFELIYYDHHVIMDGTSVINLFNEYLYIYNSLLMNKKICLPLVPAYADLVVWQKQQDFKLSREYWMNLLKNVDIYERSLLQEKKLKLAEYDSALRSYKVNFELTENIEIFGRLYNVTYNSVLFSVLGMLLSRYSGNKNFIFGIVESGRNILLPHILERIGVYINSFPVIIKLDSSITGSEFVQKFQRQIIESTKHANYDFREEKAISKTRLFDIIATFEPSISESLNQFNNAQNSVYLDNIKISSNIPYPLVISMQKNGMQFSYNQNTYPDSLIYQMSKHYINLLQDILRFPQKQAAYLQMLSNEELYRFLAVEQQINSMNPYKTIPEWFEAQVSRTPNNVAIVSGKEKITYIELNVRINQLANFLLKKQVNTETLIAIYLDRSFNMIIAILAVIKSGCAYVPLDAHFPSERIPFILNDCGARDIITHSKFDRFFSQNKDKINAHVYYLDAMTDTLVQEEKNNPAIRNSSAQLLYVIYTSGSTGIPKGVRITHGCLVNLFETTQKYFDFNENDIWTQFHSISFDFSVWEIFGALLFGGKLLLVSNELVSDLEGFCNFVINSKVTVLNQTPSVFYSLINIANDNALLNIKSLNNLRAIIFGGENLSLNKLKLWFDMSQHEKIKLINMYGITEATIHFTYCLVEKRMLADSSYTCIGKPLIGSKAYIVDENNQLLPQWVTGELYLSGPTISQGYLNNLKLTDQKFIKNIFSNNEKGKIFKTGDLARWNENGFIEYIGRIDNQVKVRGFRIELGEIESAIIELPFVKQAVVLCHSYENKVTEDKRLTAYIVLNLKYKKAGLLSLKDKPVKDYIRESVLKKLPAFMVPQNFIILDSIPFTTNGKIDKSSLENSNFIERKKVLALPKTKIEKDISCVWKDILNYDDIDIHDNFFEVGGHSLLAIYFVFLLRKKLAVPITFPILKEKPTIFALAQWINELGYNTMVPIKEEML